MNNIQPIVSTPEMKPPMVEVKYEMPVSMVYQHNGNTFVLSEREKMIVDVFVKTNRISECVKALNLKFKKHYTYVTVKKWLGREHVKNHVAERMLDESVWNVYAGENGKKRWLREMLEYREGRKESGKTTIWIMDLIGHYLGYKDEVGGALNANNMQINFYQGNGNV